MASTACAASWAEQGLRAVKMKVGSEPGDEPERVREARDAVGPDIALFVDANGAYERKQALAMAERFAGQGVVWFEEPVSSDDPAGLRLLRDRAPAGMATYKAEFMVHHYKDRLRPKSAYSMGLIYWWARLA